MKLNEILDSGLLELYVLGQLSNDELREVETAIEQYPEVKQEIVSIEKALFAYDNLHKVVPPAGNLDQILSKIKNGFSSNPTQTAKSGTSAWAMTSIVLGGLLLGAIYLNYQSNKETNLKLDEQVKLLEKCEEEKNLSNEKQNLYAALTDYNSKKIIVAPTDKYPETALIIHSNETTKKNYLQISNLPPLASNQSYQLWSLKGDNPPIPLDVFEDNTEEIISVGFVDDTNAYAITIEPRGGKDTPTLENLIGVFSI